MFIELLKSEFKLDTTDESHAEKIYTMLISQNNSEFYRWSIDKNSNEYFVANFYPKIFYDKYYSKTTIISLNEVIYHYENGKYSKFKDIEYDIEKKLNIKDPQIHKNPEKVIKILNIEKKVDNNAINSNNHYINFKNGMLNLKTKKIENHSSDFLSTLQIQSEYNESLSIKNTRFEQYLNESFNAEDIPTIQEWFGYCFCNYMNAQKFLLLTGEGKNGKGVLIRIMESFFEKDFKTNVELDKLSKPEYSATLYEKAINICGDISDSHISDSSMLKRLTGEDTIQAKALFKNPFSFYNKAKIMFSCNKPPTTSDKTFGFIRRLLIISCDKKIKNKDENLSDRLIDEEKNNITAWAIEGLYRLMQNKFEFTQSESTNKNIENYRIQNDNIIHFINEYCKITHNNSTIPKTEFSIFYKEYCKINNMKCQSSKSVNLYFEKQLKIKEFKTNIRSWKGIEWDETIKELIDNYNLSNKFVGNFKYEIKAQKDKAYEEIEQEGKEIDSKNIINFENKKNQQQKLI